MTIKAIDPISISKEFTNIQIKYAGTVTNPEKFIKNLTVDLIEQMNKRLMEKYMDDNHPEVDILDSDQLEQFNQNFDDIDMDIIYEKYKFVDVYIPIKLSVDTEVIEFFLHGVINTKSIYIDVVDEIRSCINSNDSSEVLSYDKDEIIYKFGNNKEVIEFAIITDPKI
jgi:hypothetical protein